VNHSSERARSVLDRLAASELKVVRVQEHHLPAEFANADLERNPRARG
jgi:hypothetical protein